MAEEVAASSSLDLDSRHPTSSSSYPTTAQPEPVQTAFQRFVLSLNKQDWTPEQYAQAWKDLPFLERKQWETDTEEEAIRLKTANSEWHTAHGDAWHKRVKLAIDKGNIPIKLVGQEMRRFPNLVVNATAVRAMANAIELFVASMARDAYLGRTDPSQPLLRLVDVHRLVHGQDRCFGFLNEDFAHPDTLDAYVDQPDSPPAAKKLPPPLIILPATAMPASAASAAPSQLASSTPHHQQHQVATVSTLPPSNRSTPFALSTPSASAVSSSSYGAATPSTPSAYTPSAAAGASSSSSASKTKMLHRPKCSYNNVQKMYDAMKPGSVWNDEPNKEHYYKEYQKMKDEHVIAEARWRSEYPDEYRELLEKRKADQYRAKKRRMQAMEAAASATPGAPGADASSSSSPSASQQAALQQQQPARAPQVSSSTPRASSAAPLKQQQQAVAAQSSNVAKVMEDMAVPAPWKRVLVVNPKPAGGASPTSAAAAAGSADEFYFWNTETGETTWEPPFPVPSSSSQSKPAAS